MKTTVQESTFKKILFLSIYKKFVFYLELRLITFLLKNESDKNALKYRGKLNTIASAATNFCVKSMHIFCVESVPKVIMMICCENFRTYSIAF